MFKYFLTLPKLKSVAKKRTYDVLFSMIFQIFCPNLNKMSIDITN